MLEQAFGNPRILNKGGGKGLSAVAKSGLESPLSVTGKKKDCKTLAVCRDFFGQWG